MKKLPLLGVFLMGCIILSGCNNTEVENPNEDINNSHSELYENNLIIGGVSPTISLGGELEEGSLTTRIIFEDHADVVVFPKGTWEPYFENENDYLPGNTVSFKGEVEAIDAAAGTHYYEVKAIDTLEFVSYPTEEEVKDLISRYDYCETDEDCVDFYPGCPFGCSSPINKQYLDIATNITKNFIDHQENKCMYRCLAPKKIACENYKCTAVFDEQNNDNEDNKLSSEEIKEANSIFE